MPPPLRTGAEYFASTGHDDTDLTASVDEPAAHRWLAFLRAGRPTDHGMDRRYLHLKNWILAGDPDGLLVATTGDGTGIGIGDRYGSAALLTDSVTVSSPGTAAANRLDELCQAWRDAGSPGTEDLCATLVRDGDHFGVRLAYRSHRMFDTRKATTP